MEDDKIVELYWQRSREAIPVTAERYGRYCTAVARNILPDERDAEECVNDTYLAAWNSMPDNRPARLAPYLGRITRNFALSRREANSAVKRGGGGRDTCLDELAECLPAPADPAEELEVRELSGRVDVFLRTLGQDERDVFIARYWYAAGVEDIAQRMGFTRAKTASMLHRTRKKLRAALEKEGLL